LLGCHLCFGDAHLLLRSKGACLDLLQELRARLLAARLGWLGLCPTVCVTIGLELGSEILVAYLLQGFIGNRHLVGWS
jgi:hypothetical protein